MLNDTGPTEQFALMMHLSYILICWVSHTFLTKKNSQTLTDWFILFGFSGGIGEFKPAEIQEGDRFGFSYTLGKCSCHQVSWWKETVIHGSLSFHVCLFLSEMSKLALSTTFQPLKMSEYLSRWHPFYSFIFHQKSKRNRSWSWWICEMSSVKM